MTRAHLYLRGWYRWLFRRPCDICGDRRRCWKWHVEYFTCPTCGLEASEFDKEPRDRITAEIFRRSGWGGLTAPPGGDLNV